MNAAPTKRRSRARLILGGLSVLLVCLAGLLVWQWWRSVPVRQIVVSGAAYTRPAELVALARVDTSMTLASVAPAVVAARLLHHPWVQRAEVRRGLDGRLRLAVGERLPVLLVVSRSGLPLCYLDSMARAMPLVVGRPADVPLLRGTGRLADDLRPDTLPAVRALAAALGRTDETARALLSDFELRAPGEVWLRTIPVDTRGSLVVRLGRDGFDDKLARLDAFWQQAVLPQQDARFSLIDLRFDGQIVTREASRTSPDSAAVDSARTPRPAPPKPASRNR